MEQTREASSRVTLYAPASGIVIDLDVQQGMYVRTGMPMVTIADLSHLWVRLEAYESDLQWLRYGQQVEFTTKAVPGQTFAGTVAFIDPVLDPRTRTVKVRVNVANPDGLLKPEMFVNAIVTARIARGGRVMAQELEGKSICRMHPDVVKDEPGDCDICGMELVSPEEIGYAVPDDEAPLPLVIPASAPLVTGERAVVYVELDDAEQPTFEGRNVVLGPRAGDFYLVESGLEEGERVVVHGAFKIDSALQIQGRASVMRPAEDDAPREQSPSTMTVVGDVPAQFRTHMGELFRAYLELHSALARDDFEAARTALEVVSSALQAVDASVLPESSVHQWHGLAEALERNVTALGGAEDIEAARVTFEGLSEHLELAVGGFGIDQGAAVVVRCPMAFDNRGARWLQADESVRNPYYGSSMLRCGNVVERLAEAAEESDGHDH